MSGTCLPRICIAGSQTYLLGKLPDQARHLVTTTVHPLPYLGILVIVPEGRESDVECLLFLAGPIIA